MRESLFFAASRVYLDGIFCCGRLLVMKRLLMIMLLCICGVVNGEEERRIERLEMPDGRVYESVTVTSYSPAWIKIMHRSGVAKLMFTECDEEMQMIYDYDAEKAEVYLKAEKIASKRADKKRAQQRLVDAKKMEELAKVKQEKEREYLDYKKAQKLKKERALFLKKLASVAVKVQVDGAQYTDVGIVGRITVSKRSSVNKPGSLLEKVTKWNVIKSINGVITGTANARIAGVSDGIFFQWSGRAWEIGTITYRNEQGIQVTCACFTASSAEAEAYYRAKIKEK